MAGNADAIARIGWDNTDARRGARDFLRLSEQTNRAFSRVWDGAKFGAGFLGIGSLAQAFGTAMRGIKQGLDFNTQMSDAEAGIANVLRRFDGLNRVAAKNEAAKAMERIKELEPVTAGGLQDLVGGFMGTVAAAKAAGMSTEQNIELVSKFANAIANAGLPVQQLRQELASILTGNITSDSQVAKILGITNEEVNAIKARGGDMFAFLSEKVGEFGDAGDSASVTFSSLGSAINKALGSETKGVFGEVIRSAKDLTEWLEASQAAADQSANSIGNYLFALRDGFKNLVQAGDEAGVWGGLGEMLKTVTGTSGISNEEFDMARMMEDQQRQMKKLQDMEKAAADPELKEEARLAILEKVRAERMKELEIEREAAKLRQQENESFVRSFERARDIVGLREQARGPAQPGDNATYTDAREEAEALWQEEQKLRDMQRKSLMEQLPLNEQIMRLTQEIADKRRDIALLPLTSETDRVKLEQELVELTTEEMRLRGQLRKESEQTRREAEERAKAEAEIAERQAESLEEYRLQNEILREQIAGHDEKAKQLQRELEIQRQAKQIQEQMGKSEEEALRMARERADLEDQANKKRNNSRYDEDGRRKSDGRKRIVTRTREEFQLPGSVPSSTPLLDDFYRKNRPGAPGLNETFRFPSLDEMNKRGPLRDEFKFPGLDAFEQMQQDKDPLKDKAQENNAEKTQGDPTQVSAQQVIQKMDAILTALG